MPLIECVPNFSAGRDPSIVASIASAIEATPGVTLLAHESDPDHNRAVVTFCGDPSAAVEGAFRGIAAAVERIDMREHSGVHPRVGAADVVPFVPLEGATLDLCAELAAATGERVWRELRVPVYLYEAAARMPERRLLENIRRGGLEFLRAHIAERPPDIGDPVLHPTAGAVVIGARKLLIAFNVYLDTADLAVAREIARAIRASSGGFPCIKALGLPIDSRQRVQVSVNFTDFEVTGLFSVFEAIRTEAARLGTSVTSSELIGLAPARALELAAAEFLRIEGFTLDRVLERRIARQRGGCDPG